MTNWKELALGEIVTMIDYRGKTPKKTSSGIPLITAKIVKNGRIYPPTEFISKEEYKERMTRGLPKVGDVLITTEAPLGEIAELKDANVSIGQRLITMRADENMLHGKYLKYYLQSKEGQSKLSQRESGTTVIGIKQAELRKVLIPLPPLDIQKKIAGVLGALDDKIELNNKINNNLEQQAQALFKSWFVDKEYEVERETTLGVVCKCELGGTPSRIKSEYWGGNIAWINSGEVNNFRITKASEYITEIGLKHSATKLLPRKTTVLAITGATLGQISLLEIDSCTNQSVVGVLENETLPYEFIYPYICYNIKELLSHQTGGAQQHINKQNVEQLTLSLPKSTLIKDYKNIVAPIFELIAKNCFESERLAAIRDALLPKLMSGEIDVSNVDISALTSTDKSSFSED